MATTAAEITVVEPQFNGKPVRRKAGVLTLGRRKQVPTSAETQEFASPPLASVSAENLLTLADPHPDDSATRLVNFTVAVLVLIFTSPLFLLIAIAIKLTSRGPVFYKQTRIGLDRRWKRQTVHNMRTRDLGGRPFTMYKFRTMVASAEADRKEVWATPNDRRVTKLGRYLRLTRLDELPQLLNVVLGDMNIVGPRPERPTIFAELRNAIPQYHVRQRVMPGITGWAQINQAYDTSLDDVRRKVSYDLEYLRSRSVSRDLSIMVRTIPIMLLCRLGW